MFRSLLVLLCLAAPCVAETTTFVATFDDVTEAQSGDNPVGDYGPFAWSDSYAKFARFFDPVSGGYYARMGTWDDDGISLSSVATLHANDGFVTLQSGWFRMGGNGIVRLEAESENGRTVQEYTSSGDFHWEYLEPNLSFKSLSIFGCRPDDITGQCISDTSQIDVDDLSFTIVNQDGDGNDDGMVDLVDLNGVRDEFGAPVPIFDANDDGVSDLGDVNAVRNNFGFSASQTPIASVPEPSTIGLSLVGLLLVTGCRKWFSGK